VSLTGHLSFTVHPLGGVPPFELAIAANVSGIVALLERCRSNRFDSLHGDADAFLKFSSDEDFDDTSSMASSMSTKSSLSSVSTACSSLSRFSTATATNELSSDKLFADMPVHISKLRRLLVGWTGVYMDAVYPDDVAVVIHQFA
jgi:hypothetical protein